MNISNLILYEYDNSSQIVEDNGKSKVVNYYKKLVNNFYDESASGNESYLNDKEISQSTEPAQSTLSKTDVDKVVTFKQSDIILADKKLPENLAEINLKFNGLCELICNKVLMDDLIGKGSGDFLRKKINVDELSRESIVKSHLLDIYSIFNRLVAFLFGIYPDNIFSMRQQWNLVNKNKVNEDILFTGLQEIEIGTTLKLEIFKKTCTLFSGHSLLIKKTNENEFIFFDPNTGEHRGLSQQDLVEKINEQLALWGGTDIYILRGSTYIQRLRDRNIIETATRLIKS